MLRKMQQISLFLKLSLHSRDELKSVMFSELQRAQELNKKYEQKMFFL